MIRVRQAKYDDHKKCCEVMALYEYTKAFSHMFYSSKDRYGKGDILVAVERREIVGVACVSYRERRYKGRPPAANLQYIAVREPGAGVGKILVDVIQSRAPQRRIELKVEEQNREARKAYQAMGFTNRERFVSDDGEREYVLMIKENPH